MSLTRVLRDQSLTFSLTLLLYIFVIQKQSGCCCLQYTVIPVVVVYGVVILHVVSFHM